ISVQGWKAEQAQKDMESIIDSAYAKGQPLHAILSPYDGISTGVINAIESKRPDLKPGTDNWPIITGQDAMESAVSSIARGKQSQTVFKNVNKLAEAVYQMVLEIAKGKKVSGINGKFNNNKIDVPSKLLNPQDITKDNLTDLVKDGYITQERFDKLVH
ncbi:ABC transporter substrate-binding protein, partial [Gardnerella vaginalis]